MRTNSALWIGLLLLILLPGCGGTPHATTEPIVPPTPLPDGIAHDSSPRQSSNVTEGEVIVTDSGSGEGGTEIVELPVAADHFAIVQLAAEMVDGVGDAGVPAIAHLAQPLGGYSIAPVGSPASSYGIPRTGQARTFSRHFVDDGFLRLELTNQLEGGPSENPGSVRWRYKAVATPDPALMPGDSGYGIKSATTLTVGSPHQGTLVRGVAGRRWDMRSHFFFAAEPDKTYRLTLRPLVVDPTWRWQVASFRQELGIFTMSDIAAGETASIDFRKMGSHKLYFKVWADVPGGAVTSLETASFEVLITEVPLGIPEIRHVVPIVYSDVPGPRNFETPWTTSADGTPTAYEGSLGRILVVGSGCPCTITLLPPTPAYKLMHGELVGETNAINFRLKEAGLQTLDLTLTNDAGTSPPFAFTYRSLPSLPRVSVDGVKYNRILVPLFDATPIPFSFEHRVSNLLFDFGPLAVPRFSTETAPVVRYVESGSHQVSVVATNDVGTWEQDFWIQVDGEGGYALPVEYVPIIAGTSARISALVPQDGTHLAWRFWDGATPETATGTSAFVSYPEPGWQLASMTKTSPGQLPETVGLGLIVNPAGTEVFPLRKTAQPIGHELLAVEQFQGDPLMVYYSNFHQQLSFLRRPVGSGPEGYPVAPPVASPFSSTEPRGADVVVWQNTAYVLEGTQSQGVHLWRLSPGQTTAIVMPWAEDLAQVESGWWTLAMSMIARDDHLIMAIGQSQSTPSSRRQVLLGAVPLTSANPGQDSWHTMVSLPISSVPKGLQVVSQPGGVITMSARDSMAGNAPTGHLIRTPIAPDGSFGTSTVSGSFRPGVWANYTETMIPVPIIGQDSGVTFLTARLGDNPFEPRISLTTATWESATTKTQWVSRDLPYVEPMDSIRQMRLIQTTSGVHVLADCVTHDRTIELTPTPSGVGWTVLDRLDALGNIRMAPVVPDQGDGMLFQGRQAGDTVPGLLYLHVP